MALSLMPWVLEVCSSLLNHLAQKLGELSHHPHFFLASAQKGGLRPAFFSSPAAAPIAADNQPSLDGSAAGSSAASSLAGFLRVNSIVQLGEKLSPRSVLRRPFQR